MFRRSLLLLSATAILLPMQAAPTLALDNNKQVNERSERQANRRAQRREARQQSRQSSRQQTRQQSRSSSRGQTRQQALPQTRAVQQREVRQQVRQQAQAPRSRPVRQATPRNTRANVDATVRAQQTRNRDARLSAAERREVRSQPTQRRFEDSRATRQAAAQSRATQRQSTRRETVRNTRQTRSEVRRSRVQEPSRRNWRYGERYDHNDAASYRGARDRAVARNERINRNRYQGRYDNRHRQRDVYQPHVTRRSYNSFRNRVYNNFYFGYGSFFGGLGYGFGFGNGWSGWGGWGWPTYYNTFYSPYDYHVTFGHWPYHRGFYNRRASWAWAHRHNHYHYGTYCPGFDDHVSYSAHNHYYHSGNYSSGGNNVAGTLLGAVVGGIIGAEIDGGRNRTAGALFGAAAGALVGNAATRDSHSVDHHYVEPRGVTYHGEYSARASYDENGRHRYETEPYTPPEEVRTCMEYGYRNGNYTCTKWTVEYLED